MTTRESALKKLSACQFALWEIHLYLDTHPWDLAMVEKHNRMAVNYKMMKKEFEEKYFPLTPDKAIMSPASTILPSSTLRVAQCE